MLLTLHRRLRRWLQTGGHLESGDASVAAAALREGREESGLTDLTQLGSVLLLSHHEVPCGGITRSRHLDLQFLQTADPATPLEISAESADLRWFPVDDLPDVDASVRALVTAARQRLAEQD